MSRHITEITPNHRGQAARIPGLTPADVQALLILLEPRRRAGTRDNDSRETE